MIWLRQREGRYAHIKLKDIILQMQKQDADNEDNEINTMNLLGAIIAMDNEDNLEDVIFEEKI